MLYVIAYFSALLVFFLSDMAWLGTMVSRLYRPILGSLLLPGVNLPPAFVFYLLYPVGVLIFAIAPGLRAGSIGIAILLGALFGLFTYGTYDLTNQATLRSWSTALSLADMAWGSVLGAITAGGATWMATIIGRQIAN